MGVLILKSNKSFLQIEFAIVLLLFLIIFFFIFTQMSDIKDLSHRRKMYIELENDAKDLCFLLSKTEGVPNNWEKNVSKLKTLGLFNISSGELSSSKINTLKALNYSFLYNRTKISNFYLEIKGLNNNTNYLNYGYNTNRTHSSNYNCYSYYNNEIVKLEVITWS